MRRLFAVLALCCLVSATAPPLSAVARAEASGAGSDCTSTGSPAAGPPTDPLTVRTRTGYVSVGGADSPHTQATQERRTPAQLRYTLVCPDPAKTPGPYPTLLIYSGYTHDPAQQGGGRGPAHFAAKGYAVIGVAPRGSSCSSGTYDLLQPDEARDGYDVVQWIAGQRWSDQKVAMIGASYNALMQIPVAALRPPNLVAIAAQQPIADLYRDAIHPGGIFNAGLTTAFGRSQHAQSLGLGTAPGVVSDAAGVPSGEVPDARCAYQADRHEPVFRFRPEPWDGDFYSSRLAPHMLEDIAVPVWTTLSWQDEVLGSRAAHMLSEIRRLHATVANGLHDQAERGRLLRDRDAFLDHYVKGSCTPQAGPTFEDTCVGGAYSAPRIRLWWETNAAGEGGWSTSTNTWPAPARPLTYYLAGTGSGLTGELDPVAPTGGPDRYTYLGGSGRSSSAPTWATGPRRGSSLTYTTPPLREDVAMLGSASLDLWLSSTATDTDVQVTLSEVRPKDVVGSGTGFGEVYVQQGWLRASHRALDASRSTPLLPYHPHRKQDAQPLEAEGATPLRVEIMPFGHVFRAGSRIRIDVEAPKTVPDPYWGLEAVPGPAVNTVFHDQARPSRLVLPVMAVQPPVPAPLPACGGLRGQPCRDVVAPGSASPATELVLLDASASRGQFSDEAPVQARLSDARGRPVPDADVVFALAGQDPTRRVRASTGADGVATAALALVEAPGEHVLTVHYAGDARLEPSSAETAFRVEKEDTVTELRLREALGRRQLVARVADHDARTAGVSGVTVSFSAAEELLGTAQTDGDGVARLDVPPRHYGPRLFHAVFGGSQRHHGSSGSAKQ